MRLILLFITLWSCSPTSGQNELTVKDINFKGIFGSSELDSTTVYCLLGMGYFRAPTSKNIDEVISTWISEHPNAIVKPIYTSGPTFTDEPESKITYCWVINESAFSNVFFLHRNSDNTITYLKI